MYIRERESERNEKMAKKKCHLVVGLRFEVDLNMSKFFLSFRCKRDFAGGCSTVFTRGRKRMVY